MPLFALFLSWHHSVSAAWLPPDLEMTPRLLKKAGPDLFRHISQTPNSPIDTLLLLMLSAHDKEEELFVAAMIQLLSNFLCTSTLW